LLLHSSHKLYILTLRHVAATTACSSEIFLLVVAVSVKAICEKFIIIIGIQPLGRSGQRPEFSQATGMALVRCILGTFLGVACPCFPRFFLDVPTFHHQVPPRPPRRKSSQRRKCELWTRILSGNFAEMTTSTLFRDLLHAANLRHGTDGFTSRPKEGVLRIFSPLKIRRLRPGLNP